MKSPGIVLVVAMGASVHTRRWLLAARGYAYRLVVLPIEAKAEANSDWVKVADHAAAQEIAPQDIGVWTPDVVTAASDPLPPPLEYSDRRTLRSGTDICRAIQMLRPDLVHSMEIQHAGYSCLAAARQLGAEFPPWMVSNWGSDLYLYSKLRSHRPVLQDIMRRATHYLCECGRDTGIARQLGFSGPLLPPLPASGGMNIDEMRDALPDLIPPSHRREILVKGYHGWAGRGMHILSALHLAAPRLRRFQIVVRHARPEILPMIEALRKEDALNIVHEKHLPLGASLKRLARARISVGLGISAGIDNTVLESMCLGTFPVTTTASCTCEWLRHGQEGFLVDPHDVAALAGYLVTAAEDDDLVDRAAARNLSTVTRRWDAATNKMLIRDRYAMALDTGPQAARSLSNWPG